MISRFVTRFLSVVVLAITATTMSMAQGKIPSADELLSVNGAQGKDFWIAIPPNEITPHAVSALEIYVASAFDTEVTVFDASGDRTYRRKITAGEIRTLSDKRGETNWTWEVRTYETPVRMGVHLTSDQPISVYVLNGKRFSSDGYLAIPTGTWGRNYMATTYYDFKEFKIWAGGFLVIAKENGTVIDIVLNGEGKADAKTSGGKSIGDRFTINLEEGDVYCIKGDGQTRGTFDLTGSSMKGNKPFGVISFHQRTTMPNLLVNGNGRDHMVEMTPPIEVWGKKYVSIEYNRSGTNPNAKGDVFRVVASEPGTRWTLKYYDKTNKALLGQGGGVLQNAGDFQDLIQSQGPAVLTHGFSVWEANHPIFVMQYSCSANFDGDRIHDPFMINVVPEEQFIPETIFQTPTDASFSVHKLNLIVWADTADPNYEDNLKSLVIDDVPVWSHPQSVSPTLLFNHMGDNLHWVTIDFGTQADAHYIKSNGTVKFGGYIYGFGQFDSYGWPAASGFKPTSILDTMPPVLIADTLCGDFQFEATEFRNIPDPPTFPSGDSDQVETGIADIGFDPVGVNYNYRLVLVTPNGFPRDPSHKSFIYRLEVIDKSQDAYAEYYVQDYADNFTHDTVFYFADKLEFSPPSLNFGELRLGTKDQLDLTVTNRSDGEVTLTESTLDVGTYYNIVAGTLPPEVTLQPGESHLFTIEYSGDRETADIETDWDLDTLVMTTQCGEFKVGLDGVAAIPCIVVEDFDAGTQNVNEEYCKPGGLRIENPGSDTLVITAITGHNGTNFTLSNPSDPVLPIVILPRGSVNLTEICYMRGDVGVDQIDVTFSSNADGPFCVSDSISTWTGNTSSPGPRITGHNWLERRVSTVNPEFNVVKVSNSGNKPLTVRGVEFVDGGIYYPAGTDETSYIFKIGALLDNGTQVPTMPLVDGGEVFVEVWFRPGAEVVYSADITPVWVDANIEVVTAKLEGEGILPQILTEGATFTCVETPEGVPVTTNVVFTNDGTEDLTITNLAFAAGTDPAWAWVAPAPAASFTVPKAGGVVNVPVEFTRPLGVNTGFALTVEFMHDAVPGNKVDDVITPIAGTERFSVASCSGPDIVVTDIDYGRQLANCDQPTMEFTITNTGGGNVPLEIRSITPEGADPTAFTVVNIIDAGGVSATLPFTIPAQGVATVTVRFTPTEPNAAPWADRAYAARLRIENYTEGGTDELKPDTFVELMGVGFVIPISFELSNSVEGEVVNPANDNHSVKFEVRAISGSWGRARLTDLIAYVTFESDALHIDLNSASATVGGWSIANSSVDPIDDTYSRATFELSGVGPLTGDGVILEFDATLLLGPNFATDQDLDVDLIRECLVPSTQGSTTEITNCALTKRVISISGTQFSIQPINPNPVSGGTATVNFGVGLDAVTTIELINLNGQVVRHFMNQKVTAGEYTLEFPTNDLSNGIYYLRMQSSEFTKTQQVVIAK